MKQARRTLPIVEQAISGIASRPRHVLGRIRQILADSGIPLEGARVLVVGVAYKPGVQDVRESPALEVLALLDEAGAQASYFDPLVPALRGADGHDRLGVQAPEDLDADLVLLHTLHPDCSYDWVIDHPRVLDATFRFGRASHAAVL
jgi:UDP-N-acetyl-D-mannosaminuronate dehydrogenase